MSNIFEYIGYFQEYWIGNKMIGMLNCEKQDRFHGWYGRKTERLEKDIVLENQKKLKAGIFVTTYYFPLCGKIINK